jgi:hypothetical protein
MLIYSPGAFWFKSDPCHVEIITWQIPKRRSQQGYSGSVILMIKIKRIYEKYSWMMVLES